MRNASADVPGGSGRHHLRPAAAPPRISAPTHNQGEPRDQEKPENNFAETRLIKSSVKPKSNPSSGEQQRQPDHEQAQRVSTDQASAAEPKSRHQKHPDTNRLEGRAL